MPQLNHACHPTAWCQLPINAVTDSGDSVTIPLSDSTPSTSDSPQLHPDIPRLHHVKRLRKSLNSEVETPTPIHQDII